MDNKTDQIFDKEMMDTLLYYRNKIVSGDVFGWIIGSLAIPYSVFRGEGESFLSNSRCRLDDLDTIERYRRESLLLSAPPPTDRRVLIGPVKF